MCYMRLWMMRLGGGGGVKGEVWSTAAAAAAENREGMLAYHPYSRKHSIPPFVGKMNEQVTVGLIFRTSTSSSGGQYSYSPLPRAAEESQGSRNVDSLIISSLFSAPDFRGMTLLDSCGSTLFYHSFLQFPPVFHVYDLLTRRHSSLTFPLSSTCIAAAFLPLRPNHFKLIIAASDPLSFFVYSSDIGGWSHTACPAFVFSELIPCRRPPVHAGEGAVYLDITAYHLARFSSSPGGGDRVVPVPKVISLWERELGRLDPAGFTRYGECMGQLQCVKFNPILRRVEVYQWMETTRIWQPVYFGRRGFGGTVVGIIADESCIVVVRNPETDDILLHDLWSNLNRVVLRGWADDCGPRCFEDPEEGEARGPGCARLHAHENAYGSDADVFTVRVPAALLLG